jgi:hypothetical protein
MLIPAAVMFPLSVLNNPKAPTPYVVIVPPVISIRPPLSASAPDAGTPYVVIVRFVPNILLLASNACRASASIPLVVMLNSPSCLFRPANLLHRLRTRDSDDQIHVLVIEIPFAVTVRSFEAKMPIATCSSRSRFWYWDLAELNLPLASTPR